MHITFEYYPEGKTKALTMSYDDGQIYDRKLVEIFNTYNIKGTFHINSGKLDREPCLDSKEIRELFQGHEVSAHSLTHPFLTKIPTGVLIDEILEDRKNLELLVGYPIRGMSYPFGDYNDEIIKTLPSLGIEYSRTVHSHGNFSVPNDFLTWHPTCHHEDNLLERCKEFLKPNRWNQLQLFYVWGHSFEFNHNNNWSLIIEFCKTVSNNQNIWYAANIEIMDYIKALRNLKFSVTKELVYNPSDISVWIGVDGSPVEIIPGQNILIS